MVKYILICISLTALIACKKTSERSCWKTYGESTKRTISIEGVNKFILHKNISYVIHQNDSNKIVVEGGENMVNLVEVSKVDSVWSIENKSYCNFLRDFDKKIKVHIHYPEFKSIYAEVSDSIVFKDTIKGNLLDLEMRESGGVTVLTTQLNDLRLLVSAGPGSFIVNGYAKYSTLKVQGQGFGDALGLNTKYTNIYQNSYANLKVNLQDSECQILIDGAGDVQYIGEPKEINLVKNGAGNFSQF